MIPRKPHHKRLKRSQKPMKRGRLNPKGKRAELWQKVRTPIDKKLFESNQVYCLVCGSSDVTPAHAWRRHHSTESMLSIYAPLCLTHHHRLDALGERYAYPLISYLIECAESEREPEIDFRAAADDELKAFAEKLMPEDEFWKLRRKLCRKNMTEKK